MAITAENKEIHRTVINTDEVLNQQFYEKQNSRTTSSLDNFTSEMIYLNFKAKSSNYIQAATKKTSGNLSNQINLKKTDLPIYFNENRDKLNNLYYNVISKIKYSKDKIEAIQKNYALLSDNISELYFNDIHLEITKSDVIKFTTIFNDNKILIISKDVLDNDTDIIYSYFINKQLIASDVTEIKQFTEKFKEYLSL